MYDRGDGTPRESTSRLGSGSNGTQRTSSGDTPSTDTSTPDIPESSPRHRLELRLLHHWVTKTALSLSTEGALGRTVSDEEVKNWTEHFVNLAFNNDAALYALYYISALHLAKSEPDNREIMEVYHTYLDITLRKHYKDISEFSKDNADAICMTSTVLRIAAFALLQERSVEPYEPPMQWLQLTHSAGHTMEAAVQYLSDNDTLLSVRFYRRVQGSSDWGTLFEEKNRQGLLHLLRPSVTPNELWDAEIQEAYAETLSLLGSVQLAMASLETPGDVFRLLLVLPALFSKRFVELVNTQQPRALVILAHYFALLTKFYGVWWIGNTGRREIRGIHSILPHEWNDLMSWPLMVVYEDHGQR